MKIIYNRFIPFKGFSAINLFGVIFAREECRPITPYCINHEKIHSTQMKELLYVGFYLLYFIEWLYRVIFHFKTAYRGISFEVEAYQYQYNYSYLKRRKRFAQWRKQKSS